MIFNNRECWERTGRWPETCVIPNGVDLDVFRVTRPLETRRPRVLWTGSELYRQLKGYDDLILPLRKRLEAQGVECDVRLVDSFGRNRWTPEEMAEWYDSGTVLVCASEAEGTPNPALEAAACGCVIVSTRVGNMPDLIRSGANGYLVQRDLEALFEGVQAALAQYEVLARQMQEDIRGWGWAERSQPYFALFRELLAADGGPGPARVPRRPDAFDEVTVFVTTVGAPTFQACLEQLCRQDCTFRLKVLDHVAPLGVALQRMVDTCTTPFYVQVDEDMLLYPHAIRTLWERIRGRSDTALVVGNLYDVHLERHIAGVKIFRHEAVRDHQVQGTPDWVAGLQQHLRGTGTPDRGDAVHRRGHVGPSRNRVYARGGLRALREPGAPLAGQGGLPRLVRRLPGDLPPALSHGSVGGELLRPDGGHRRRAGRRPRTWAERRTSARTRACPASRRYGASSMG